MFWALLPLPSYHGVKRWNMSTSLTGWQRAWDSYDSYPYLYLLIYDIHIYIYIYIIHKSKDTKHACIWFWCPSCSFQNTAMPSCHNMFISFNTLLARHYKTPKLQHPRTTQIQKLCKGICKKSHVNLPSCFHPSHQDTNCDFFKWVWGGCSGTLYIFEL